LLPLFDSATKGAAVIFLAFLLPLGIYLLYLGALHRRPRPVLISGTWDLIGLLFAASGFLLFTGPALLNALAERSAGLWSDGSADSAPVQRFALLLSILYFIGVLLGAALMFQSRRRATEIYNIDSETLETSLTVVCRNLGLQPTRSGSLYVFGVTPIGAETVPAAPTSEAIRMERPSSEGIAPTAAEKEGVQADVAPVNDLVGLTAVLETESFASMRHVSLRWEPADSLLRRQVEAELERILADTTTEPSDLGGLLTLSGLGLLVLTMVAGIVLILLRLFAR
jgi:hypothetical protein